MKKTRTAKKPRNHDEEMLSEYRFEYGNARPNRFAGRINQGSRVVVIEPDVAQVFATGESVNTMLRALIAAMPHQPSESISEGRTNG